MEYHVDLGWAGKYYVKIREDPRAYREDRRDEEANPFIGSGNQLCVGNRKEDYNHYYNNHDFLDCAIIINLTLSCKDDSHGYKGQKWKDL